MKTNTYGIDLKKGVLNRGNLYRMARVMERQTLSL